MSDGYQREFPFRGRLVMVGFGAIGQGVLPLLLRHIAMAPQQLSIVTADLSGSEEAGSYGVQHQVTPLLLENYRGILDDLLGPGDFLLNLAINVASVELIRYCRERGVLYLDACIEPWQGGYTDPAMTASARSNYGLRGRTGLGQPRAAVPGRRSPAWLRLRGGHLPGTAWCGDAGA